MTEHTVLRILLLGTPTVLINDQPLQIQRRLLRWMLFYLATEKEMVGRADLALLFWPDEPEEDARRHLRETLSKLRAQLPDPESILAEQDRIGLDPKRVYSDVLEFESLFSQTARVCAQTPASSPLSQAVHQKVVSAVRLWRSARFLAGATLPESENLNNWLLSTSQQMETQRQRLLERLVDHDIANGDVESALQWLRLALEGDETNESLHFQMLNLLHKQGRYSEALNYCTYIQELFRREGFDELPPSLLNLSRKIREGAAQPAADNQTPAWPTLADMQVPFVGRQATLRELQLAARRGSPAILFGEAGAGKSRLLRELFFSLKPAPRLLLAPARKMEAGLLFQPFIDLLRHDIQADEWKQMDLTWVTPLALLLPELSITRPEIHPPQVPPSQEHSLIFEALHQLFLSLGKKQRFLLFLDNAQWSDTATLSALAYLAERGLFGENGSLVLAARPGETPPHLERFLNQPRGSFTVQRLILPPLSSDEIASLAHYILGDDFTQTIVPSLERETGGNPLFILETLRLVLDDSLDPQRNQAGERLPLANSVRAVIRDRLQQLNTQESQVLNTAAIAGREFSVDLLESTCMMPPEHVVQALESLVQSNLVKATLQDRPSSGYTFVHEKIREVILLDMSPARKRLIHLRIARAMEQKHQGQSAEMEAVLASHYEEAGELSTAFQHWLDVALFAARASEKDTVISAFQRAEQILQRLGLQSSDISIYQLFRQWGRFAYSISDPQMMEQVYNQLLQFGQERQNPLLTGSAYNGLAQVAELCMQPDQGLNYLDKAAPFLEQAGRLFEYIEAQNRRGVFLMLTSQYEDAQNALQKALTLGASASDAQGVEARAQTEYWLSLLLNASGWPMLALEMARRSIKDADETFSQACAARAFTMQSVAECYLGRYAESVEHAEQGLAKTASIGLPLLVDNLHGASAYACLASGNLDACWEHAHQAIQLADLRTSSFLKEGMMSVLGKLFFFLGNFEKSAQFHQMGSQAGYANFHALDNHIHLGRVTALLGDCKTGLEIVEQAIRYTASRGLTTFYLPALLAKASILMREREFDEASRLLTSVSEEARRRVLPEIDIQAKLQLGWCANLVGQTEQSVETAHRCADEAHEIGHLPLEIESCSLWLKAASRLGLEEQTIAKSRLENGACTLALHATTPELQKLLLIKQKAWTKFPEIK